VRITIYTTFIRPPPKRILNIKVSYTLIKILSSVFQSVDKNVKIFVRRNIAFFSLPILCPFLNYFTSFLHPPGGCKNVSVLLLILLSVISPPFAYLAVGSGVGCPLLAPLPLLCLSPCRPVAPALPCWETAGAEEKRDGGGGCGKERKFFTAFRIKGLKQDKNLLLICPLSVHYLSTYCPLLVHFTNSYSTHIFYMVSRPRPPLLGESGGGWGEIVHYLSTSNLLESA